MIIYLAGYETACNAYNPIISKDIPLFLTYYYRKNTEKGLTLLFKDNHKGIITIDSGAHSFFGFEGMSVTSHLHTNTSKRKDPFLYFEEYIQWLKIWQDKFSYFVELDLQEIVGHEIVNTWRKRYEDEGLIHKCIFVYHTGDKIKWWEDTCKNIPSRYVGIEGIRTGRAMLPYNKLIKIAYDNKCKVHGFAFTRPGLLHYYPFYSVDSTSWTIGPRYGMIPTYKNGKVSSAKSNKKHYFEKNVPLQLMNINRDKESQRMKLEYSAIEYVKLQQYLTALWEKRGIKWND